MRAAREKLPVFESNQPSLHRERRCEHSEKPESFREINRAALAKGRALTSLLGVGHPCGRAGGLKREQPCHGELGL